ncbi:GGDEF and EAL domain-containing protein [Shewanella sp. Isolate11]|uniref:putative bifunctional diguanylate cyclase/phosphodiesterase n=1 Tax=Shewanella sp. Isolate11 TaxID=2908530 RepID=UPI001EFCEA0C|nr:GGDEF and EAL domain-containing protein [Shewanella sp. Isolate11]MCG9697998.1 GGDEF and EAL domain-containing protein [Shewanella sp. Isolate11]
MNYLISESSERLNFSRVEEEIALVSSDMQMVVYTLIDHEGYIDFANHAVWQDSSASLVIDGYDEEYHRDAVSSSTPVVRFNPQRESIQAYFPIVPLVSNLSIEKPEIIYLEYDLSPALSHSDYQVMMSILRIGIIGGALLLFSLYLAHRYLFRPLGLLSKHAANINEEDNSYSSLSSCFSELASLTTNLSIFKTQYLNGAKQLRDSEQRWLFAVEVSRNGIWDWDITTNTLFLSDRWKDMLGYKPDELESDYSTWESRLHPEDKKSSLDALKAYLAGKTEEFETVHRLRHKQGHYIWVLDRGMTVAWDDNGNSTRMIGTLSDVSEDVRNQKTASHLVKHDPLTDLANRRALMDALYELGSAPGNCAALFLLDLDNFKIVNDALGHHGGDRLLIQIAARLSSYFASDALIARLAADEFVVLVKRLPQDPILAKRRAQALASQTRQLIGRSFNISEHSFNLSTSIGIAIIDHAEKLLPEQQVKRAYLALQQAKDKGRDRFIVYSKGMDAKAERSLLIRTELARAIEAEQLSLVYQPLLNRKGEIASVEALLRWNHPQHGAISPAEFIPIAEGSGLIIEIGHWVLLEACRFIRALEAQGLEAPMVSINVSARQFNQHEFPQMLLELLRHEKVAPQKIELELTEYALLTDLQLVRESMQVLRDSGVSIAVDDFGTGYSSLSYIQGLPLTRLKLDASFIREMGSHESSGAIVKAMIDMAHGLDLKFVAEGVEIQSQYEQLMEYQCDLFQGYLFYRPLAADKLRSILLVQAQVNMSLTSSVM